MNKDKLKNFDDLLGNDYKDSMYNKSFMMDYFVFICFSMAIMFSLIFIDYLIFIVPLIFTLSAIYIYIKEKKKLEEVQGKIFMDSTTYMDDMSWDEQIAIIGYENVNIQSIGIKDPKFYVSLVHEANGKKAYYVSEYPLKEEPYLIIPIETKRGTVEGLGWRNSTKLIDIIIDPNTGESIPVKQVIMSARMAEASTIELDELPINPVVINPIIEIVEHPQTDIKTHQLKSWSIQCNNCGASLDLSKIQNSELGMFIECEYCGVQNGLRSVKN
jgi:hypothetical protein